MPVSRAEASKGDPAAWQSGARRATTARANVAAQLTLDIIESDMTGSGSLLADRLRLLTTARGVGDLGATRAAAMDVAHAAAAYAVALDVDAIEPDPAAIDRDLLGAAQALASHVATGTATIELDTSTARR